MSDLSEAKWQVDEWKARLRRAKEAKDEADRAYKDAERDIREAEWQMKDWEAKLDCAERAENDKDTRGSSR